MSKITISINGKQITTESGTSILNAAKENGIEIPNLCYAKEMLPYGACGLCVVEVEGIPKLLRACASTVSDGMIINVNSERALRARRVALELLMSDHTGNCKGPCTLACPAGTDCQGYLSFIANDDVTNAVKLIKERIPLPSCIGRVCPHPCETKCARNKVDEPLNIAGLKYYASDTDLNSDAPFRPQVERPSGKTVGIIGGGPGGLSAAYFLSIKGHKVTVFDKMPKMGGMLRYGIPEYRLPKAVLDKEIALIKELGVEFKNNYIIDNKDEFDKINNQFDATLVCIGAWNSSKMRVEGEDLKNVFGGIDFLREVAFGNRVDIGKSVAVVGGGNTAMDACRTAVRLGAENVYIIYRRTENEMPAEKVEIKEAKEEGVVFKFLTNPIKFVNENGKVCGAVLQKMELGEPDSSGRRSPVAIDGMVEEIKLDSVIMAIGQYPDLTGFESLEATKRNTICAKENDFTTNIDGVFAIGDATNKGADIAIAAIGEAHKASNMIDAFLNGIKAEYRKPYYSEIKRDEVFFEQFEKLTRENISVLEPEVRSKTFKEVSLGIEKELAIKEAERCLECGCKDFYECKLIRYTNDVKAEPEKFSGEKHEVLVESENKQIIRDTGKCILCGLCVRVCDIIEKAGVLGLVGRGFNTQAMNEFGKPLNKIDCTFCNKCVEKCPTGAIMIKDSPFCDYIFRD